jgi:hypothetical protein
MSALPDDPHTDADLVRAARDAVEEAERRLDEAAGQLAERRAAADQLESLLDAVLAVVETPVVVVDRGRRVTALSRAASARLGCRVGDPLTAAVPAESARQVGALLDAGVPTDLELPEAGVGAHVQVLVTGHAVLTLAGS